MNNASTNDAESWADDELLLELLADDELPAADREELLVRVTAEPDGWQQVAEAFLQSQSLGRCLRAETTVDRSTSGPPRSYWRSAQVAAVAAAVIVGFTLGFAWPRMQTVATTPSHEVEQMQNVATDEQPQLEERLREVASLWPLPEFGEDESYLRVEFRKINVGGVIRYTTHQELPLFMLQSMADAGHEVRLLRQDVNIGALLDDPELEQSGHQVSVFETQITPERVMHL